MRYAVIELEGSAGTRATLRRPAGADHVEVRAAAGPEGAFLVGVGDREGLWSAAQRLYRLLEGRPGTRGDAHGCLVALELLADP